MSLDKFFFKNKMFQVKVVKKYDFGSDQFCDIVVIVKLFLLCQFYKDVSV